MKRRILIYSILVFFLAPQIIFAQPNSKELDALAEKLVKLCLDIREGEAVLITGSVRDAELLENIAVHIRKVGAHPMISIGSDRLTKRMYTDVAAKDDSQKPELDMKLANIFDALISVEIGEVDGLLADIPAERIAARTKANEEVVKIYRDRKVRSVYLGNNLYPTEALAERYKISKTDLTKIFWDGVNVDFNKLKSRGEALSKLLKKGKQIHITTPAGTDLTFNIEGRTINVSDGIVTKDEILNKGTLDVWLPAGEVYLVPNSGTAEGKVILKNHFYDGKVIEDLAVNFKDGKVVSINAKSGLDRFKDIYDALDNRKSEFAYLDFGINPNVKILQGSAMTTWMSEGMVTIGIGGNIWAGGENAIGYGQPFFLIDAIVSLDGKIIIENGILKI